MTRNAQASVYDTNSGEEVVDMTGVRDSKTKKDLSPRAKA